MRAMPPRRARVPLAVLVAATRTRRFWMTVARHAMPVIGVLVFGWSAMNIAVFFLLESWLFLSTRLTVEVTFDPHFGGGTLFQSRWRAALTTLWMFALSAIACGVLVFGFGGFIIIYAFQAEEWHRFVTEAWARPSFLLSVFVLTSDVFVDGLDLKRRLLEKGVKVEELVLPDDVHDSLLWRNWTRSVTAMSEFFERALHVKRSQ